jgi:MYXO-CTERM domain-containing protein
MEAAAVCGDGVCTRIECDPADSAAGQTEMDASDASDASGAMHGRNSGPGCACRTRQSATRREHWPWALLALCAASKRRNSRRKRGLN